MSEDPGASPPEEAPMPAKDEAPRLVRVLFGLGGICTLMGAYILASTALFFAFPTSPRTSLVLGQLGGLLAPALVLVLLAETLGLAPALPGPHVAILRRRATALVLLALSTFLVAMALGIVWVTALRAPGWAWVAQAERLVLAGYGPILEVRRPLDVLVILVALTVVPAACEEWAFRGFLQRVLRGAIGPRSALWGSAILFAAFHVDPLGLPSRVVVGLSLGLAYERLGCLWPGMAIHAGYNLMVLCVSPWDATDATAIAGFETPTAVRALEVALPVLLAGLVLWAHARRRLMAPVTEPAP
jgi:membrane protease YdiL (CAAX protease family)